MRLSTALVKGQCPETLSPGLQLSINVGEIHIRHPRDHAGYPNI